MPMKRLSDGSETDRQKTFWEEGRKKELVEITASQRDRPGIIPRHTHSVGEYTIQRERNASAGMLYEAASGS